MRLLWKNFQNPKKQFTQTNKMKERGEQRKKKKYKSYKKLRFKKKYR